MPPATLILLGTTATAALGLALLSLSSQRHLTQETRSLSNRVGSLETSLREIKGASSDRNGPGPANAARAAWHQAFIPLQDRLDQIDQEIALLWQRTPESGPAAEREEPPAETAPPRAPPAPVRAVYDQYSSQLTTSDWGSDSARRIGTAFQSHRFFSLYGGDLETDCRETACRITWNLPDPEAFGAAERDRLLSMAQAELSALAAQNSSEIGRLETEWDVSGAAPRLSLYFHRTPDAGQQAP